MLLNYLKVALRNVLRHRGYAAINVLGLAAGLGCSILIYLWIADELSYDDFHAQGAQIYRVNKKQKVGVDSLVFWKTSAPLAAALKEYYPEVLQATRFRQMGSTVLQHDDQAFIENDIALADPGFFKMFSFNLMRGDANQIFTDPHQVVLAQSVADKYFPRTNPIGQILTFDQRIDLQVVGILQDPPHQTHLQFDILLPFILIEEIYGDMWGPVLDNWDMHGFATYIQLDPRTDAEAFNRKLGGFYTSLGKDEISRLIIQPVSKIHLHSTDVLHHIGGQGDIRYIYIFSLVALLVLIIACVNFVNLTTSRSISRAREVGVRKVIGAKRHNLMIQFFSESTLLVAIALLVALGAAEWVLPAFNQLTGKEMTLLTFNDPGLFAGLLGIFILTVLTAGLYPAMVLAAFRPARVLKGKFGSSRSGVLLRRSLVFVQLVLTVVLITSTLIVSRQVSYIQTKKLGFEKDQVIYLKMRGDMRDRYTTFKQELAGRPGILSVSASSNLLSDGVAMSTPSTDWEGKTGDELLTVNLASVDADFLKTFHIELAEGQFFNEQSADDTVLTFIINEEARKAFGMEQAENRWFSFGSSKGPIIGVVKDYHFESLHNRVGPLALVCSPDLFKYIFVEVGHRDLGGSLTAVENTWRQFAPGIPFEYHFLDEAFDKLYFDEARMEKIFFYFTLLCFLIAGLGLFGLVAFSAEQRTKEIGIRKVLGATVTGIFHLIVKEYLLIVLLANLVAWPLSWYAMTRWLQSYAYRIELGPQLFLLAGIAAALLALVTVSFQAVKAALSDPVKSLRYE